MTHAARPYPALRVHTRDTADHGPLEPQLDADAPLLWMRRGFGICGIGTALRLEFTGPSRFQDAAEAWRQIAAAATVDDPLGLPGTGLVALGSFAFADTSTATSVLIVPSIVIGRASGRHWITRIGVDELPPEPAVTRASTAHQPVTFQPGALVARGLPRGRRHGDRAHPRTAS